MFDFFKKSLLFGFGAISFTKEKAEQMVNEMVDKGQVSKGEAQKLINDLVDKGEQERKVMSDSIKAEMEKLKSELGLINKDDIYVLERRISKLEELVNQFLTKKEGE